MAPAPIDLVAQAGIAPPPSARSLRAQAVHRLQIGLAGLGAMLLLVGLANIIMDRARRAEAANPPAGVSASSSAGAQPASDPLADIGVVPAADHSAATAPVERR